jgi:hypothetical protein
MHIGANQVFDKLRLQCLSVGKVDDADGDGFGLGQTPLQQFYTPIYLVAPPLAPSARPTSISCSMLPVLAPE